MELGKEDGFMDVRLSLGERGIRAGLEARTPKVGNSELVRVGRDSAGPSQHDPN